MASYMTVATRKAYEEGRAAGRADERSEWEELKLGGLKATQDELASANSLLDANRKEVSRLNEIVNQLSQAKSGLAADFQKVTRERDDLRRQLSLMAPGKSPSPDERIDRIVNAIRDMDKNIDGTLRRLEKSIDRVGDRI